MFSYVWAIAVTEWSGEGELKEKDKVKGDEKNREKET